MPPAPLPQDRSDAVVPVQAEFSSLGRTRLLAVFDEPELSSDGGALLLREAAEANGILEAMASAIRDERAPAYVHHTLKELLTQCSVQICHGYEDANDCDTMRHDAALKAAAGRTPADGPLVSQPTMSRLENSVCLRDLIRLFYVFVDSFAQSYGTAPPCIVIDMDPTPNRVYGDQQLALFNAHYDEYCLMPFHVYEGVTGRLISTVVRPGKTPTAGEIMHGLRETVLRGTALATATFETLRLRLLKIAARVETRKSFVRFHLPLNSPAAPLFVRTAQISAAVLKT